MKKILLVLMSVLFPLTSFAKTMQSITLGNQQTETMWIEMRLIKKKKVTLLGYKSPNNKVHQQVIPKSEYASIQHEMNKWYSKYKSRNPASSVVCTDQIVFKGDKDGIICGEQMPKEEKTAFLRWFEQNVKLNLGI